LGTESTKHIHPIHEPLLIISQDGFWYKTIGFVVKRAPIFIFISNDTQTGLAMKDLKIAGIAVPEPALFQRRIIEHFTGLKQP
jgi:hypothetical protein